MPQVYMFAVTSLAHFGICYWFVIVLDLGIKGAALALNVNFGLGFVLIFVYTLKTKLVSHSLARFDSSSFQGLLEILKFGVPNAALVFFDWGAFEVQAILVGISGINELAASVILSNFSV